MRCHYMSDLHLEAQEFLWRLPQGDVLIVAGDVGHASCLDPKVLRPYDVALRERMLRFFDEARTNFAHVLLVPGNHEHYEGIFEDTVPMLRTYLPGVTVLDDSAVEIDGVRFFGITLWSDFEGGSETSLETCRRGIGDFFFVKTRAPGGDGLVRLQPEDALCAHARALKALAASLNEAGDKKTVVVSHHAPSRMGLNPEHTGNGLDGAFTSDLDRLIETLANVPVWVHGHTHIKRTYRIGDTTLHANCRGFDRSDPVAQIFTVHETFEV
jgi:3',5'-cyclic AMP phosphodiesterase CpdA